MTFLLTMFGLMGIVTATDERSSTCADALTFSHRAAIVTDVCCAVAPDQRQQGARSTCDGLPPDCDVAECKHEFLSFFEECHEALVAAALTLRAFTDFNVLCESAAGAKPTAAAIYEPTNGAECGDANANCDVLLSAGMTCETLPSEMCDATCELCAGEATS
eukprot:SAG11_NODE_8623_length_994_cov_2.073743_1_plen_162_part_00